MDLEAESDRAARLCVDAQQRLETAVSRLDDATMREPSRLPGWTRAHVLTHLARNADAHARRVEGALMGQDVPKYLDGEKQRRAEIEQGAGRPAADVLADLVTSQERLAALFRTACASGWPNADFRGGGHYGVGACPAHRLREVEMHHVDLDVGYEPTGWPAEYVDWEISHLSASVPDRMAELRGRQTFLAWLAGRGQVDPAWRLDPWG